jgi:hypothetical protein
MSQTLPKSSLFVSLACQKLHCGTVACLVGVNARILRAMHMYVRGLLFGAFSIPHSIVFYDVIQHNEKISHTLITGPVQVKMKNRFHIDSLWW